MKSRVIPALIGVGCLAALAGAGFFLFSQTDHTSKTVDRSPDTTAVTATPAKPTQSANTPTAAPDSHVQKDVTYCTVDGTALKMDLYFPTEQVDRSGFPIAVYVHGGGWTSGDKTENLAKYKDALLKRGIAVAAVNYRLAATAKFPAMIEDVKCAIRSLRANSATFAINPDKIAAFGGSAGGHLVSLLGAADATAGWDVGEYTDVSSAVTAVVDMYGPADLTVDFAGNPGAAGKVFTATDYAGMAYASPVHYVSPEDPAFLIVHGLDDTLVPFSQSQEFYDALVAAGVDVTLVPVTGAGHTFAPTVRGVAPNPTIGEIVDTMADWLADHLK
jgi:acetyl esterase/lipase